MAAAKVAKSLSASSPEVSAEYQIFPAPLQDSPPMARAAITKGTVGDAAVEVHATVVLGCVDVLGHPPDLRVLADERVVVRRAGLGHRPQGTIVDAGQEDSSPNSQSAASASWPRWRCLMQAPKTSDIDSLRAPACPS